MVGRVMDSSSEPGLKGRFYCRIQVVSYGLFLRDLQPRTSSSTPWRQSSRMAQLPNAVTRPTRFGLRNPLRLFDLHVRLVQQQHGMFGAKAVHRGFFRVG